VLLLSTDAELATTPVQTDYSYNDRPRAQTNEAAATIIIHFIRLFIYSASNTCFS